MWGAISRASTSQCDDGGRTVGAAGGKPLGLKVKPISSTLDHGAGSANLGLADRTCRLNIENDRSLQIDQIIVRISEERVPFVSASPLSRGIGSGDELRRYLAGGTPCSLIESVEILPYGASAGGKALPVRVFCTRDRSLLIGFGGDQAGVHRKSFAANQAFLNTAAHHGLEDMPERITIPEATIAVLPAEGGIHASEITIGTIPVTEANRCLEPTQENMNAIAKPMSRRTAEWPTS